MFQHISIIEPVPLRESAMQALHSYAPRITTATTLPKDNTEIIRRIGDADCVLLRHTTSIDREVLDACPHIRYIGLCCSLYTPDSSNVDIRHANSLGITVCGVRDYGDEGVPEYVISELVRFLHGFGGRMWKAEPSEIKGLKVGVLGMGVTGKMVADALRFFGAEVYYYSRTRKPELEAEKGYTYLPMEALLSQIDILCTCLLKNTVLLHEKEFRQFDGNKILMNISIGPAHDIGAAARWVERGNYLFSDTPSGIDPTGALLTYSNVFCVGQSAGLTAQAMERLGQKVLANMDQFLAQNR